MATSTHVFQAPKGTRDFPPGEMAVRRHLEGVWRRVSTNHGFDEIDGPTFEHLDLYTVKSGPQIVSELFSFRRAGGSTDYALRPEFTPTLARMFAAGARSLPRPTKWFSIPTHFRAERPQRGRLREFVQWNVDVIGAEGPSAEAEVIGATVGVLEAMGLTPEDATVRLSHRRTVSNILLGLGLAPDRLPDAFALLDNRDKMAADAFVEAAARLGLEPATVAEFDRLARLEVPAAGDLATLAAHGAGTDDLEDLAAVRDELDRHDLLPWCRFDLGIVRGLAYYTGTVFEVHALRGRERAIAGGGRYDGLIELFGGPPTPAVGLAMGDVVIRLVLEELERLERPEGYLPRPDVFVIDGRDEVDATLPRLVAALRGAGLHARQSYRSTRNVGKLLGDASKARARLVVILGRELADGQVAVKDLASGVQDAVPFEGLVATLRQRLDESR